MTPDTVGRTERRLSPALLVGGAFALSTLLNITMHVGEILFTDHDPHAPEGPIASIASVSVVGGAALVLALAIAVPLAGDSRRARIGAVVLGLLTVVSLVVFWSGAPATLGAAAAWLGGLAKGSHPDRHRPRFRHLRDGDRHPDHRRDHVRRDCERGPELTEGTHACAIRPPHRRCGFPFRTLGIDRGADAGGVLTGLRARGLGVLVAPSPRRVRERDAQVPAVSWEPSAACTRHVAWRGRPIRRGRKARG